MVRWLWPTSKALFAGPGLFIQRRLQPVLLIALGNGSHRFRSYAHTGRHPRRLPPTVKAGAESKRCNTREDSRPFVSIPESCCRSFFLN